MTLLDLFRAPKDPDWKHPEVPVRIEGVLRLPATEQDTLADIARNDPSPHVRRAAIRKVEAPAVLAELARADADGEVRAEAADELVRVVAADESGAVGEMALPVLSDPRHLAAVVRQAKVLSLRHAALARLNDGRALAQLAREAEDASIRKEAFSRIDDPALFASIAMGSPYKDVALLALERVDDPETLRSIADRARAKAAARRARGRFDLLAAKALPVENPEEKAARAVQDLCERLEALSDSEDWEQVARSLDDADAARARPLRPEHATRLGTAAAALQSRLDTHARERAEQRRQEQARAEARNARTQLCETVEGLSDDAAPERVEALQQEWAGLAGSPEDDGALERRFQTALAGAAGRRAAAEARRAALADLETLCADAERVSELDDLAEARKAFAPLDARWTDLTARTPPGDPLQTRFRTAADRLKQRQGESRNVQRQTERANKARIEELCKRVEALVEATTLAYRDTDVALRESKEALDGMPALPSRKDHEALTARLRDARQKLYPRFQELKQDQEWKRWANVSVQEDLCQKVEALRASKDFEAVAKQLRDIDAAWKAAAEVPREKGEAIWDRFRAVRDEVRGRCDAYFAERDALWAENAKKREALCQKAEALADSSDWVKTAQEVQALQTEWKTLGPTSRAQSKALWDRFHAACDRFFSRRKEDRHKRREDSDQALTRKKALCERAAALADSTEWEATAAELRKLQAEWKGAGHVAGKAGEEIWEQFRAHCQRFFERHAKRHDLDRAAQLEGREALCRDLEALLASGDEAPSSETAGIAEKLAMIVAAWRSAPALPEAALGPLTHRFTAARNAVIAAYPAAFAGTELDPAENRRKLERLCEKVEALVAGLDGPPPPATGVEALAERLRSGLARNAMGGKTAADERWKAASDQLEGLRTAWARVGAVPGPEGETLAARFDGACRRLRAAKPASR